MKTTIQALFGTTTQELFKLYVRYHKTGEKHSEEAQELS